jgi:hypothetical protein
VHRIMNLSYSYCIDFLEEILEKLEPHPFLEAGPKDLRDGFLIIGDLHGSTSNLEKALKVFRETGARRLVFLGDYADRGRDGLGVLCRVMELQVSMKERVYALRGNHESRSMNSSYGFIDELYERFGSTRGLRIYQKILGYYKKLAWLMVAGDWLLVHGGIPCKRCASVEGESAELGEVVDAARNTIDAEDTYEGVPSLLVQAVWNDPEGNIEWFHPSIRGPGIYFYGRKAWRSFLVKSGLKGIIRAHEVKDAYALWQGDGSYYEGVELEELARNNALLIGDLVYPVFTVFTSEYHHRGAGALVLWDDSVELVRLN